MGIGIGELKLLDTQLNFSVMKKNDVLLELGNNYIKGDEAFKFLEEKNISVILGGEQHQHGMVSKAMWSQLGYAHVSIDLNGMDEAYKIDLRTLISNPTWFEVFDIVYDGGTGEHVHNQYNLFKNIHNFTKLTGTMIRILPEVGSFPNHCSYYYTCGTFETLCEIMGYELLELKQHPTGVNGENIMVYAVYKKVNSNEFMSEETFKQVPIHYTGQQANDTQLYPYLRKL
jgi:hypothetical protein